MAEDPAPADPQSDPSQSVTPASEPPAEALDSSANPEAAATEPVATDAAPDSGAAPAETSADPFASGDSQFDQAAIDELLKQANFEDPSAVPAEMTAGEALPDTSSFELPNFQQAMQDAQVSSIDLLRDVELNVKIELGRSRMLVEDVLKLGEGSVVELDKLAGDPVDVFVNDRLVARGEVLVLNDNFCVRVNEIVAGAKDDLR